jgi:6-phosphogluconolactonase
MLAENQDSDSIVTFRIDQESGTLEATGDVAQTPMPVCIKFLT